MPLKSSYQIFSFQKKYRQIYLGRTNTSYKLTEAEVLYIMAKLRYTKELT